MMWIPKALMGAGLLAALAQAVAPSIPPDVSVIGNQLEHISLVGFLGWVVVVLWKSNSKKDDLLLQATKETQAALQKASDNAQTVIDTQRRLTDVMQVLQTSLNKLEGSIAGLPCTVKGLTPGN